MLNTVTPCSNDATKEGPARDRPLGVQPADRGLNGLCPATSRGGHQP